MIGTSERARSSRQTVKPSNPAAGGRAARGRAPRPRGPPPGRSADTAKPSRRRPSASGSRSSRRPRRAGFACHIVARRAVVASVFCRIFTRALAKPRLARPLPAPLLRSESIDGNPMHNISHRRAAGIAVVARARSRPCPHGRLGARSATTSAPPRSRRTAPSTGRGRAPARTGRPTPAGLSGRRPPQPRRPSSTTAPRRSPRLRAHGGEHEDDAATAEAMTNQSARLYVARRGARSPSSSPGRESPRIRGRPAGADPRLAALAAREQRLQRDVGARQAGRGRAWAELPRWQLVARNTQRRQPRPRAVPFGSSTCRRSTSRGRHERRGFPRDGHGRSNSCSSADEAAAALDDGGAEFHRLERHALALRSGSELSLLNRSGRSMRWPGAREVVELALAARERTGGRFDPTVHDALVAGRLRQHVRGAAPDGGAADSPHAAAAWARRRPHRARPRRPSRPRRDRQGLRSRARSGDARTRRPVPRQRRR